MNNYVISGDNWNIIFLSFHNNNSCMQVLFSLSYIIFISIIMYIVVRQGCMKLIDCLKLAAVVVL